MQIDFMDKIVLNKVIIMKEDLFTISNAQKSIF